MAEHCWWSLKITCRIPQAIAKRTARERREQSLHTNEAPETDRRARTQKQEQENLHKKLHNQELKGQHPRILSTAGIFLPFAFLLSGTATTRASARIREVKRQSPGKAAAEKSHPASTVPHHTITGFRRNITTGTKEADKPRRHD